jgi:hypothetical protein
MSNNESLNEREQNEREKYDHSAHSTAHREPGDLNPPANRDPVPPASSSDAREPR